MVTARFMATSVALLLVAVACSSDPASAPGPASPASGTGSPAVTATPTGGGQTPTPELLDFEAPLLDGGTFRGEDLAGKDVAFWFWAPW